MLPHVRGDQRALALCVLIERGQESPAELSRKATRLFELEIRNHFDIEERILFPVIQQHLGPMPLIEQLLTEHRQLAGLAFLLPAWKKRSSSLARPARTRRRGKFEGSG